MKYLAIFLGGGVGALLRFLVAAVMNGFLPHFPAGTLIVNMTGSFFIGVLVSILSIRGDENMYALLVIGLLGGFTTFSAFSWETLNLIQNGRLFSASLNVILNLGLCLAAVVAGNYLGKQCLHFLNK